MPALSNLIFLLLRCSVHASIEQICMLEVIFCSVCYIVTEHMSAWCSKGNFVMWTDILHYNKTDVACSACIDSCIM
jgi:hypothetical protein